jgi:hypothetical protein
MIIDSVTPSAARRYSAVVQCGRGPVGILRLDDTILHPFRPIKPPHENTRTTASFCSYPARRTRRTMATVVRPDAPRFLRTSTPPNHHPVLVGPPLCSESESYLQGREMSALAPRPIAFGSSTSPRADARQSALNRAKSTHTSIALILAFMNWFSVAVRSRRSFVRCIGLRPLSMSVSTCIGTRVVRCDAMSSSPAKYPTTSFLPTRQSIKNSDGEGCKAGAHTLSPTCLPVPGSFVESLTTVVPRLYNAFASPIRSCSRSPWIPAGGSDCAERGESGAGGGTRIGTSDGLGGI